MLTHFSLRSYYCRSASAKSAAAPFFLYPLQVLLGGLLVEAEAGQLAPPAPWLTNLQWERCPRWPKSHGDHRCDRLARSGLFFLCLHVKQFDWSSGRLFESCRSLWRVLWTVLADTSRSWASFMTLSRRSFSTSAALSAMETVVVIFL